MKKTLFFNSPLFIFGPILILASFYSFCLLTEKIETNNNLILAKQEIKKSEKLFELFFFKYKEDIKRKIQEANNSVQFDEGKILNPKKIDSLPSLLMIFSRGQELKMSSLVEDPPSFKSHRAKILELFKPTERGKPSTFHLLFSDKGRPYLALPYKISNVSTFLFILNFEHMLKEFKRVESNPQTLDVLLTLKNKTIPFHHTDFHIYTFSSAGPISIQKKSLIHKKVPLKNFFPGSQAFLSYFMKANALNSFFGFHFRYFWEWFFSFFIFAIVFVLYIKQMLLLPLSNLEKVAKEFSNGNHKTRFKKAGPFLHSFGNVFNLLLERVTKTEEKLQTSKLKAENAEKTKSSFLANMSHEIRSPLHTILGMEEIMSSGRLVGDQKRFLELLRTAGDGLLSLINNILDLSKIDAGELHLEEEEFELAELLFTISDLFSIPANKKGIEIYIDVHPNLPQYLKGDSHRINQILTNLLSNAVKFTSFGSIVVKAEQNLESGNPHDILFSVIDNGMGISQEKIEKLFSEYFQEKASTAREYGGTGLGLAITKALVSGMKGTIGVKSTLGRGTTFFFNIPFKDSQTKPTKEKDFKGKKAIFVDTPPQLIGILQSSLKETGLELKTLSSDEEEEQKTKEFLEKENHPIFIFQKMENVAFSEYCKNHFSEQKKMTYLVSSSYPIDQEMSSYLRRPLNIPAFKTYLNDMFHPNQKENKAEKEYPKIQGKQLSGNILIADDSSEGQLILKLFLKSTNIKIEFASDGKEALSKFKEKKYDLVLMDMQMPIMDGLESTSLIRQFEKENHYDPTPILALTAYAFKDEKEKSIAAGCDDHISKPIVKAKLLESLKRFF